MTLDHDLVERAHHAYRDEYRKNFPAGGDAGDDAEACRCGVEAVLLLALNHRPRASGRVREPLRWREGEPSDDEIYNGLNREGGVAYDPSLAGETDA
jgi:hypothetical protein